MAASYLIKFNNVRINILVQNNVPIFWNELIIDKFSCRHVFIVYILTPGKQAVLKPLGRDLSVIRCRVP